ncbi:MAG: peptidase [Gammaproteobacteria bacterium HGW-Gammaproteobacteria-2]|jgi:uncharacterized iron-regulated membrane protein|nr:MAG: peptidase [Gammaproteobacteria bacterium HGW-Gammaproteobacteria-2]
MRWSPRAALVRLHRWAGLYMAIFLVVAGSTGVLLAFLGDLEVALNPEYRIIEPVDARFQPLLLHQQLQRRFAGARIDSIPLYHPPGEALHWWMQLPDPDHPGEHVESDVVIHPYTGAELSRRTTSIWPVNRKNLMAFVYRLHYSMALGNVGLWLFGVAALVWTFDSFIGFWLTLPRLVRDPRRERRNAQAPPRDGWFRRWSPAWRVRWGGSRGKRHFDLHRATGLWLFPLLLAIAWAGVSFNLGDWVYRPTMHALFGMTEPMTWLPKAAAPREQPELPWLDAYHQAQMTMAQQAQLQGFGVLREQSLRYEPTVDAVVFSVLSDRDIATRWGHTELWLDGSTGRMLALELPSGVNSGRTLTSWVVAIHTAAFGGRAMQALIALVGLGVVVLSLTGVAIWLRKRRAASAANADRGSCKRFDNYTA